MKIDFVLILAAGMGTRMGVIGTSLPKLLWPVFEKTILELQISYARKLGINKIFINLHHQYQEIMNYVDGNPIFDNIVWLYEKDLLDIGGAVHNVASQKNVNYSGNLLILNGDQFLFCNNLVDKMLLHMKKATATLVALKVKARSGYNGLSLTEDNDLKGIIPEQDYSEEVREYLTYSGVSLIDLSQLVPFHGPSKFFQTVANYEKKCVKVIELLDYEYWDFGTKKRYYDSLWMVLEKIVNKTDSNNNKSSFLSFCLGEKAVIMEKLKSDICSYGQTQTAHIINLSSHPINHEAGRPIVVLEGNPMIIENKNIFYNNLSDLVESS